MNGKRIYLAVQALLLLALTAMLAAAAVQLCREGLALRDSGDALAWIYTKEKIADRLAPAAPVFLAAAALTAAGLVLGLKDEWADRAAEDAECDRDLIVSLIGEPSPAIRKERTLQRALRLGGRIGFALCMLPVAVYLIHPEHFPEDRLEEMFSSLLWTLLPWTALGVGCLAAAGILRDRSLRRETAAAKACMSAHSNAAGAAPAHPAADDHQRRVTAVIRLAVLTAALAMITAGALNGGWRDVLIKAINLCTECVGLG